MRRANTTISDLSKDRRRAFRVHLLPGCVIRTDKANEPTRTYPAAVWDYALPSPYWTHKL
jgi:hypothetical protein